MSQENNFIPNQKDYCKLRPFQLFMKNNFPFIENTYESLDIYGLLCEIVKFLNNVIKNEIIVTENQQALYDAFIELNKYVSNYFDNLDVQEEINNKLDDMVEQGTLQEIIADYLNSKALFGFDSVSDMKNATNLIDGSYATTLGFYEKNDGGAALYKIRNVTNDDNVNNINLISLNNSNTLVAEIIIGDKLNIKQIGAKGNYVDDDTASINAGFDICNEKNITLYIPVGKYLVSDNFDVSCNVICDNADFYYIGNEKNDYLFNISSDELHPNEFSNIHIYCNKLINGISFNKDTSAVSRVKYCDLYVTNPLEIGILIKTGGAEYNNLFVNHNLKTYETSGGVEYKTLADDVDNKIGIKISNYDNWINNARCYGFGTGVKIEETANYLLDCKIFVNYNAIVISNPNDNEIYECKCTGHIQENYGTPLILSHVSNSVFDLVMGGNGVVDSDTAIDLQTNTTAGYDKNNKPIACINLSNSFGNLINVLIHTRVNYARGHRQACERGLISADYDTNTLSGLNKINISHYQNANRNDGYPQLIFKSSSYDLLSNEIIYNTIKKEDLLQYLIQKLGGEIYTSSDIIRTEKSNGYNIKYTGSSTKFVMFKIDTEKSIDKDIYWSLPFSNEQRYDGVTITPYFSIVRTDDLQVTYQDNTSRSINNRLNGRNTILSGYISKETMRNLANYTSDVSLIRHIRVGFQISFNQPTDLDIDVGNVSAYIYE